MKRYQTELYKIYNHLNYPEDINVLQEALKKQDVHIEDYEVQLLYRMFSDEYFASWLVVENFCEAFVDWCLKEMSSYAV